MLRLENIIKNYEAGGQSFPALKGVSLAFRKSEFVSILGPSGCGKTTLLNIIGGLDHYTSGDLVIEGKSTKQYSSHDWDVYRNYRIGFIFQSYNLIPHQNIVENVELALTIAGYSKDEKRKKAMKALDMVGLKNAYKKMPNQLSGGQCQRVAIARALVNEPDILLGDEPTGALDSKTSVQIMKLIKKISKKKLVIMVTHNPPLAKEYSTRIISLLDGDVVGDTNPYKLTEEAKETRNEFKGIKTSGKSNALVKPSKAKMSFLDAFKLSAKNLISKRKRTIMIIAASSIGIVGVSAVLAVSSGVKDYIKTTQKDMLSNSPLTASETSLDLVSILRNVSTTLQRQAVSESIEKTGKIDIEYITGALITQAKEGVLITNDIDDKYVQYLKYGAKQGERVSGIVDTFVDYNCDFSNNIYTTADIMETVDGSDKNTYIYSLNGLKNIYTGILDTIQTEEKTDFTALANVAANFPSVVYQGLDNVEYLKEQYDLVDYKDKKSSWPKYVSEDKQKDTEEYECVVVLNKRKKLGDLIVTLSGLLSQKDFIRVVLEYVSSSPRKEVIEQLSEIAFENVLGKSFYYIPNGKTDKEGAFKKNEDEKTKELIPFNYNYKFIKDPNSETFTSASKASIKVDKDKDETTAKRIKVVGIITPKEGRNYGSLSSGIYFQSDLANKIMTDSASTGDHLGKNNSELYNFMTDSNNLAKPYIHLSSMEGIVEFNNKAYVEVTEGALPKECENSGLCYPINFCNVKGFDEKGNPLEPFRVDSFAVIGSTSRIIPQYNTLDKKQIDYIEISSKFSTRHLAGRKLKYSANGVQFNKIPVSVSAYSRDFDTKNITKAYLEKWNSKEDVKINETTTLTAKERTPIIVPDNLTIVISMINNLITTTTVSLTIFASLSLVVSTVMISIITYISVMERIKEIGVIRSLGGRKKDVSHLFNAETFILGGISGLFGIAVTYIFELVLDIVIYKVYKIPMIANLRWWTALIMVALSIVLTAIAGLIPARSAAKKDPVTALRSE